MPTRFAAAAVITALTASPIAAQQGDTTATGRSPTRPSQTSPPLQQVTTASGAQLELSGMILINGFSNNANTFLDEIPQWVTPPAPPPSLPNVGASASARQSRLTLVTYVPEVMGASFRGEVDVDFFGGLHPSDGGRTWPNLRLRRTRADLEWQNVSVMIGQETPPIADLNPSSLAAIGIPGFTGSGNLYLWIPQVRVQVHGMVSGVRLGLEGTAMAPNASTPQPDPFYTEPDQAERSQRPFVEGRLLINIGNVESGARVTAGGHYGWLSTTTDELLEMRAAAATLHVFTRFVELRGEGFIGEGLLPLGGGGIYQTFAADGSLLMTKGGWAQLNVFPMDDVEVGGGYGMDDPDDDAFAPNVGRRKNAQIEAHVHWTPSPLVFGVEFRRLETTFGDPALDKLSNNHINIAAGFVF